MESVASVALAAESHRDGGGLEFSRTFTREGVSPYEAIEWETRTASITNERGEILFIQEGVEIPKGWSQTAANIVVSKYFHGQVGTPHREKSVRQLVERVVRTMTDWGVQGGYFSSAADSQAFHDDLAFLLLNQYASFNSPVWFNCGIEQHPQCSACFINSVEDTMDSILHLARTEGRLFKYGSGTGTNFSPLRSSRAKLSGGGIASGPVSFMKGFDAFAGVIKSGGKTRRAAKMVILDIDHPDIVEFIECKSREEKKAWTLMEAGYDGSVDGEAYGSIFFQNANNSVRVTDEFMKEVDQGGMWSTRERPSGQVVDTYPARELLRKIADSCHICGDPGMQFDSTVNRWHTCRSTARINASNPCSEYMFLDDSACNLASFNLLKFVNAQGDFDVNGFRKAVDIMLTAQEIIVDNASYPTEKIGKNSRDFRPLGLGYANLGALLMYNGLPYDSDEGRHFAAAITAVMTGEAYLQSARISAKLGPFAGYAVNRESFLEVMRMHRSALQNINPSCVPADLMKSAQECWDLAVLEGTVHGFRNAQATVLAPTGTIGFMMDCDTTGVEPDLALVKFKKLVGGGTMKIVNNTIPSALAKLGYSEEEIKGITRHIDENGTIEGAPFVKEAHLPAFDCALKPQRGSRSIHYMGHIKMMSAVQPFISGAISKTVNVPENITVDQISDLYMQAWRLGLKAIAIYRDNSKRTQPLNASHGKKEKEAGVRASEGFKPVRRKLPAVRRAMTHKFSIGGHEGYITVGMYDDGQPGEIFLVMAKEGSAISGLMDSFATAISLALQYGVPLKVLIDKFSHVRFEPSGHTGNPEVPFAKSIVDYIFRWLASKFLPTDEQVQAGVHVQEKANASESGEAVQNVEAKPLTDLKSMYAMDDAPTCAGCGSIMVRNGSCYKCMNCGETSGCS
ncbi:MAG TPA: vitamin B12-dependent ribonucleotide reductase [Acidobacteriota bacterium]|nr:vitamin B12-dependent ribonucleotide reductase [Acidobacteriota bacterium]